MQRPYNKLAQNSKQNHSYSQSWCQGVSDAASPRNFGVQGRRQPVNRSMADSFFNKTVASQGHQATTQGQNSNKNFKFVSSHSLPQNRGPSGAPSYPNSGMMLTQPMQVQGQWVNNQGYPCTQSFAPNYPNLGASGAVSFSNPEMHPGMMINQPTMFDTNAPVYWPPGVPIMPLQEYNREYMKSSTPPKFCQDSTDGFEGHSKESLPKIPTKENKSIKLFKKVAAVKTAQKEAMKTPPSRTPQTPTQHHKPETLFVATNSNDLSLWSELKVNVIFEVIGTLDSQILSQGRHVKSFLLQDSQGAKIQCQFFETDRDIPKMWRGKRYRCVGKYKTKQDLFHAFFVRDAAENDVRAHRKMLAIGKMRLRSLKKES